MAIIDSHQHFWNYDPERHDWITDRMSVLKRDFLPPDLEKEVKKTGVDGCIAVQADQTEAETESLLELAEKYEIVRGVVGWLDIQADNFEERLEHYAKYRFFKGLRHIVQDEPEDRFLLRNDFLRGIEILGNYELTYDILIYSRHLPVAVEFVRRFPDHKFVLDHLAKPKIKDREIEAWEDGIRKMAGHPGTCCKISGLVTEADWEFWKAADFKPYLDVIFDAFGTDRLMFGSDWPVCTLAASYREVYKLVVDYIGQFSEEERQKIMGGNAVRFYGLDDVTSNR